jgi:carboxymethylenebutenolidase
MNVSPTRLRCWLAEPVGLPRAGVLVLPEIFGLNAWVRGVAGRLAAEGFLALAVPLFARTAPQLELGYGEDDTAEGRRHKALTTTPEILADVGTAARWLMGQLPGSTAAGVGCVGFCFGGHAALLAASLPEVAATADFYGAGVATGRPGGGPPSLELLPQVHGRLWCFCGSRDPLIPLQDVNAIEAAVHRADPSGERLRLLRAEAGHGYMCDARADFAPEAAAAGWSSLLELFETLT